ncbi:unnamed protein product [Cochlearia groenlandica]
MPCVASSEESMLIYRGFCSSKTETLGILEPHGEDDLHAPRKPQVLVDQDEVLVDQDEEDDMLALDRFASSISFPIP